MTSSARFLLKWKECGLQVTILSGDKDCLQLVDDSVQRFFPLRDFPVREYGPDTVKADMGIRRIKRATIRRSGEMHQTTSPE